MNPKVTKVHSHMDTSPLDNDLLKIFDLSNSSDKQKILNVIISSCINYNPETAGHLNIEAKNIKILSGVLQRHGISGQLKHCSFILKKSTQRDIVLQVIGKILNSNFPEGQKSISSHQISLVRREQWEKIAQASELLSLFCKINAASIFSPILYEQEEDVIKVLKNGFYKIISLNLFNDIVHKAAKQDSAIFIARFGENGAGIDYQDVKGRSPLHVAIKYDKLQALECLVGNCASLELHCDYQGMQLSTLGFAVALGRLECLDMLAKLSTVEWKGRNKNGGETLLHIAVHFNQIVMLEHLLTQHYSQTKTLLEEREHKHKKTPLALAAFFGNNKALSFLCDAQANLESIDDLHRTALHHAAINGHFESVKLLIDMGADPNCIDMKGDKPSILAKDSSIKNLLINLEKRQKTQNAYYPDPQTLILEGGGFKGTPFIGIIKALEKKEQLKRIKRFAGTRAGAIFATLLAFRCESNKITEILDPISLQFLLDMPEIKDDLKREQVKRILSGKEKIPVFERENFREMIDKVITERIFDVTGQNISLCTFGQLKRFIDTGKPFKHLHIFCQREGTYEIIDMNSEDKRWKRVIISDALCSAISIPKIFTPHHLWYKDSEQERYRRKKPGQKPTLYHSVGISRSVINFFDYERYRKIGLTEKEGSLEVFNTSTLSIHLCSNLESPKENQKDLFCSLKFENNTIDRYRLFQIDNTDGDGLLEFDLSKDDKKDLISISETSTAEILKEKISRNRSEYWLPAPASLRDEVKLPLPNEKFVGRSCELKTIEEALLAEADWHSKKPTKQFLICGASGVGKSELACKFANKHIHKFSAIYLVNYGTPHTVTKNPYLEIANSQKLQIPKNASPEEIKKSVFRKLEYHSSVKPWLLIFDHIDENVFFLDYPHRGGGAILYISRNNYGLSPSMREYKKYLHLGSFSEIEAKEFLNSSGLLCTTESLQKLACHIGHMPIALKRAAEYIKEKNIKVEDYLVDFRNNKKALIEYGEPNLLKMFSSTITAFKKVSPVACAWLFMMVHFGRKDINRKWLNSWLNNKKEADSKILSDLKEYGFVSLKKNAISFNPLVSEILLLMAEDKLFIENYKAAYKAALEFLFETKESQCEQNDWLFHISVLIKSAFFEKSIDPIYRKKIFQLIITIWRDFISKQNLVTLPDHSEKTLSLEALETILRVIMKWDSEVILDIGNLWRLRGHCFSKNKNKEKANQSYSNAIAMYQEFEKHAIKSRDYRKDLCLENSYKQIERQGKTFSNLKWTEGELEAIHQAFDIQNHVTLICYIDMAIITAEFEDYENSLSYCVEALKISVVEKNPCADLIGKILIHLMEKGNYSEVSTYCKNIRKLSLKEKLLFIEQIKARDERLFSSFWKTLLDNIMFPKEQIF